MVRRQLAQLLDQQRLHFIGCFERAVRGVSEVEDVLQPGQPLRLLPKPLDELGFLRREPGVAEVRFHPEFIAANGCVCTFYSAEILPPLTRF